MSKKESNVKVIAGKEFDLNDPNVWDQVSKAFDGTSRVNGRLAQENDELRKKLAQNKVYNLSGPSQSADEVAARVKEMEANGSSLDEINQVWREFHNKSVSELSNSDRFDDLWNDYKRQRPELEGRFRDKAEEEVTKETFKRNHLQTLKSLGEGQFEYLDQYFEGSFRRKSEDLPAVSGDENYDYNSGKSVDAKATEKDKPLTEEELNKQLMKQFKDSNLY